MSTQRPATDDDSVPLTDRSDPWTTANLLTLLRITLTIPFLYFIVRGQFGSAVVIFFIAGVTDFADGYVARRYKQRSRLGQFLDPIADKLLTTAAFVALAIPRDGFPSIPVWLAAAVVGRDLVIVLGSMIVYRATNFRDFKPTFFGKVNTFVELGLIVCFLAFHSLGRLAFLLPFLYAIVVTSVIVSGIEYVLLGIDVARSHKQSR